MMTPLSSGSSGSSGCSGGSSGCSCGSSGRSGSGGVSGVSGSSSDTIYLFGFRFRDVCRFRLILCVLFILDMCLDRASGC